MEMCCGQLANIPKMQAELKALGATEFVAYFETHITEDCSTEEVQKILADYIKSL